MLWFKRNLGLAAAILLGVVLAGVGVFWVWTKKGQNDTLDEELERTKTELARLMDVKPTPDAQNVAAVRRDLDEAKRYADECRRMFPPSAVPSLNSQSYKSLLETTTDGLRRQAHQMGVEVPTNYHFSFEAQSRPVRFEQATLIPLAQQLTDISTVCKALFKARIHQLEGIRRVATSEHDSPSSSDILTGVSFQTNHAIRMAVWPYEFSIECFSGDLAGALSELTQVPGVLLIKTASVQPSGAGPALALAPAPDPNVPTVVAPPPVRPIGRGARQFQPPPRAGAPAPKPAGLKTALEERLLRVILLVQVVKPDGRPSN